MIWMNAQPGFPLDPVSAFRFVVRCRQKNCGTLFMKTAINKSGFLFLLGEKEDWIPQRSWSASTILCISLIMMQDSWVFFFQSWNFLCGYEFFSRAHSTHLDPPGVTDNAGVNGADQKERYVLVFIPGDRHKQENREEVRCEIYRLHVWFLVKNTSLVTIHLLMFWYLDTYLLFPWFWFKLTAQSHLNSEFAALSEK